MEEIQKIPLETPFFINYRGKQVKLIPSLYQHGNHGCIDCFFKNHCDETNGVSYLKDLYGLSCNPEGNLEREHIIFREVKGKTLINDNPDSLISEKIEDKDSVEHISNTLREYLNKSTHGMKLINFNFFFNDNDDAIHVYTFYLGKPEFTIEDFDKVYNLEEEETLLKQFAQDVSDEGADHININIITENTIQLTFVI